MKITKSLVKLFEDEQKQFGTKIALHNLIWDFAAEILYNIGVKKIKTTYKEKNE